ncbi:O-succinylbenzoic acid--CoA ligase [Microbacterium testaceum]|uniref:AMP-binding protein n=1 Tax=Microbacterium TaxID=33882 RepID=UPI002787AD70|nr:MULTISPECIES: AMP-binding protein [Microbacterium]MDQ1112463.1 O-succinylbenzoic acid--CoA ligase [Microbacterium testaceum]MDR6097000.1 O-succinylbenzoic acid--CoA ligase [Microbacterium sp. SORGH_AS_0454]
MRLDPPASDDPRDVLRALRAAVLGAGPAVALGGAVLPGEVPPGTAAVVTTSGSTGVPKSVVIGRNALIASAYATAARIGEGAWLLAVPASYVAGVQVIVRALLADREPAVVAGPFRPEPFAAAALGMASHLDGARVPSYTSLVPAQLQRLLDAAEHDATVAQALRSFEAILIGGQALAPSVRERAEAVGARIVRTYGSSETSGGCVYDGVPLDGVDVAIVDGEVRLSGPTLAEGYLGDPERTASVFPRVDGTRWYRTGDGGEIVHGVLQVTGRLDNVIVSGGVNVSLDRVEAAVRGIAGLESAVVVPIPDATWGQGSAVVVPGIAAAREHDLLATLREVVGVAVGAPARPARVVAVDELPTLRSGKPDRATLRRFVGEGAPNPRD